MVDARLAHAECHATSGVAAYDHIAFCVRPIAQPLAPRLTAPSIVRHLGVDTGGLASAAGRHDDVDVLLMNLGSSGSYYGEFAGERISKPLRRDAISFVPAGTDVYLEFPASHSALMLAFPRHILAELRDQMGVAAARPIHCEHAPRIAQLVRIAEREAGMADMASTLVMEGLVRAIGSAILQDDGSRHDAEADRVYISPGKLRRVTDFVLANLDQPIGLEELAAVADLSPFHFSRVFKKARGESPCQFVRSARLEHARRLLSNTDLPLAELALACGFANQSHFTAAFSRATGLSPARYRRLTAR